MFSSAIGAVRALKSEFQYFKHVNETANTLINTILREAVPLFPLGQQQKVEALLENIPSAPSNKNNKKKYYDHSIVRKIARLKKLPAFLDSLSARPLSRPMPMTAALEKFKTV